MSIVAFALGALSLVMAPVGEDEGLRVCGKIGLSIASRSPARGPLTRRP